MINYQELVNTIWKTEDFFFFCVCVDRIFHSHEDSNTSDVTKMMFGKEFSSSKFGMSDLGGEWMVKSIAVIILTRI